MNYPALNNPVRRLVMDSGPPQFAMPPLELLRALGQSDGSAEARSHQIVRELLDPPRPPAEYHEAKAAILDLCSPRPNQTEEDRQRAIGLNMEALEFFAHVDAFIAAGEQSKREALEQRHSETYLRCRLLTDRVGELQRALGHQNTISTPATDKLSRAQAARDAIYERRPGPYPSAEEIAAWQHDVDAAQVVLDAAKKDSADAQEVVDQIDYELKTAQRDLSQMQSQEEKLREQLISTQGE